jgi:hypothetical protein
VGKYPFGKELWNWPEFKAFAKRLGIPDVPTTELRLRIPMLEVVEIEQEYRGQDTQAAAGGD